MSEYRLLHTMIRVFDQEKSIAFYSQCLGMKVLRQTDYPGGKFTNTFMGYGEEKDHTVIELTYNWDPKEPYEVGTGFGHLAVGVPDIYKACEDIRNMGAKVVREPGPMKHGTSIIAFVEDPDGYKIELVEKK